MVVGLTFQLPPFLMTIIFNVPVTRRDPIQSRQTFAWTSFIIEQLEPVSFFELTAADLPLTLSSPFKITQCHSECSKFLDWVFKPKHFKKEESALILFSSEQRVRKIQKFFLLKCLFTVKIRGELEVWNVILHCKMFHVRLFASFRNFSSVCLG